jgi:transcriptional regulator with XRE-family HTH domain
MKPEEIRALRERLRLTQELFARILGVSFATVNRWENSKSAPSGDYARVLQTLQQLTVTKVSEPPIDWQRVGALGAMAAVAGFSPLLTLGAALAPVLIAHLPSWADVPLGTTAIAHRLTLSGGTQPVMKEPRTPPPVSAQNPRSKLQPITNSRLRARAPTR